MTLRRNIAFVTVGGIENYFSINYEHIFVVHPKLNWSFSIGLQPFTPSKKFSVPVSINTFTSGSLHHLELDFSATFYMDKYHPYNGGLEDDFNKQLYLASFVCYRLQNTGKLVLKAGIGPQLVIDPPSDDSLPWRTRFIPASVFATFGFAF
jgi:hypothetical protein